MPYMLLLKWGAPLALLFFAYTFGTSYVTQFSQLSSQVANLKRDLALRDGREASFRRMIDRRDAAIDASKCKVEIRKWVNNPDTIPRAFNPFNQLDNPGRNYGP